MTTEIQTKPITDALQTKCKACGGIVQYSPSDENLSRQRAFRRRESHRHQLLRSGRQRHQVARLVQRLLVELLPRCGGERHEGASQQGGRRRLYRSRADLRENVRRELPQMAGGNDEGMERTVCRIRREERRGTGSHPQSGHQQRQTRR